ncbi:hypothetical protein [Aquimarina muelleri]|uniref:Uncharacterized protein n=1 Tax=Aquimarina muelleri TaxID=279356 RepID=A0A918N476_9FLAO|nr:hypothetical protein [Aquimarina muelleri]MCX2764069.1 hypothetical protein [Aquimarina muelleri]GGX28144.1 hypothetical protein GCM10007384_31780 [Aquimarina muelleri]
MLRRTYNFKDSILLEWGDVIISHLKLDIKQFADFDPKFDTQFITNLQQQIKQGYEEGGDLSNMMELKQDTKLVENAMKSCLTYYKRLKYWVVETFPEEDAIQKHFGVGMLKNIRNSQPKMMQYIEGLEETIEEYRSEMIAAGTPIELLNQSSILSNTLRIANKNQEQKKGKRAVATAKRIETLNELYKLLQKVNTVANYVFEEQPAKRKLYRTPTKNEKTVTE